MTTTSKPDVLLASTVADPEDAVWEGERPVSGHIGRYTVRGTLGAGGMGIVVAAHDPQLEREVAIKIVGVQHGEATARLIREAKAMAKLSHPNVVTVHEVVAVGDRAGIVMELVDGEDLATWSETKTRDWRDVIAAYVQAARGLAAAHHAGIVHRDFKPSNALIGKDGIVRVSDFGLARHIALVEPEPLRGGDGAAPAELTQTRTGAIVGTPAYMAPEQHANAVVDARTDQWAFACSLYEALYGQRPFGNEHEGLRDRIERGELVEPSESNVPRAIRVALRRALAVKPADRFATMDELIAALMAPMLRRSRLAVAAVAAVAVAALAVVLAVLRSSSDDAACEGLDAPLVAAWNPARSQQLRARMIAAGQPVATTDRVVTILDEHGAGWLASRARACTTARRGLESSDQLDRQMRCLDQYLVEFGGVVDGLLDPAGKNIASALDVVDRLHPIADCDDPRETLPRPSALQTRQAIDAAETDLARARALDELDRYEAALALAQRAAAVGKETDWPPLEARALVVVGECQQRLRDFKASFDSYDRAAAAAAAAHDDADLTEALVQRFLVLSENLGQPSDALAGRRYIELALVRAGQPPRLRANWLHVLAIGLFDVNRFDEGLAAEREAVTLLRGLVRPGNTHLVDALETEANIQILRKQFDEAEALLRDVLAARIAARGPQDASVAVAENNWGFLEFERGHWDAAREHWERAERINVIAGTRNFRIYANLGVVDAEQGQLRAAVRDYTTARAVVEREASPDSLYLAECDINIAWFSVALGEYDRARPLLAASLVATRRAKAPLLVDALFAHAKLALANGEVAQAAADFTELVAVDTDPQNRLHAVLEAEVGRAQMGCRGARPAIERAVTRVASDPYRLERIEAFTVAAGCDVEVGDAASAIAKLEPELQWFTERNADAEATASARFALALAVAAQGDLKRARALAEQARTALYGVHRAEVTRWLAQHPAP